jgi:hypothetical protein
VFVLALELVGCGGSTQDPPPSGDLHVVMIQNGKNVWPEIQTMCQIGAAAHDCGMGRAAAVDLLEQRKVAVPPSCH